MVITLLLIMLERSGLCHFKAHNLTFPDRYSIGRAIYGGHCIILINGELKYKSLFLDLHIPFYNLPTLKKFGKISLGSFSFSP